MMASANSLPYYCSRNLFGFRLPFSTDSSASDILSASSYLFTLICIFFLKSVFQIVLFVDAGNIMHLQNSSWFPHILIALPGSIYQKVSDIFLKLAKVVHTLRNPDAFPCCPHKVGGEIPQVSSDAIVVAKGIW